MSLSSESVLDAPYVDPRRVNEERALLIHQLQPELFALRFLGQVVDHGGHMVKPRLPLLGIDGHAPPLEGLAGYVKPVQEDVLGHDIAHDSGLLEVGAQRVDLLLQFVDNLTRCPRGCGLAFPAEFIGRKFNFRAFLGCGRIAGGDTCGGNVRRRQLPSWLCASDSTC